MVRKRFGWFTQHQAQVNLVLLDLNMPKLCGIETSRPSKRSLQYCRILTSGESPQELALAATVSIWAGSEQAFFATGAGCCGTGAVASECYLSRAVFAEQEEFILDRVFHRPNIAGASGGDEKGAILVLIPGHQRKN